MNELDFSNRNQWFNNIKKLWIFLESKWELFFTDNKETKYYYQLLLRTNKSWSNGQITTIAFLYVFREIFKGYEFKKIHFSLDRGDLDDFGGIDIRIFTKTGEEFTIQVKSGEFQGFSVEGIFGYADRLTKEELMVQQIKNILAQAGI